MTDRPAPPPPDDDTLAAYLASDLDADATAAVERRLDEPEVAARLDAIAETLVALRAPDDVATPDGFDARLHTRLDEARGDPAGASGAGGAAAVSSLDAARAGRGWNGVGAAAAVLTLLAVVSLGVVQGLTGSGEDAETMAGDAAVEGEAQDDALESLSGEESVDGSVDGAVPVPPTPATDDDAVVEEGARTDSGEGTAPAEDAGGADESAGAGSAPAATLPPAAQAAVPGPPVVDDTSVPAGTGDDLVAQFSGLPELDAVMGTPVDVARGEALASQRALATAPTVQGSAADECLATSFPGREPAVFVRVQAVVYEGQTAVAYVVASSVGGATLDRGEVIVVEAATCAVLAEADLRTR